MPCQCHNPADPDQVPCGLSSAGVPHWRALMRAITADLEQTTAGRAFVAPFRNHAEMARMGDIEIAAARVSTHLAPGDSCARTILFVVELRCRDAVLRW